MNLKDFSMGLSRRIAPNLINVNESTICTNIDLTAGSLRPLKGLKPTTNTSPIDKSAFTVFKGSFIRDIQGTSFVEFNDALYISNGTGTIKKTTDGINLYDLGIIGPVSPLITSSEFTFTYTLENKSDGDTSDIPNRTLEYLIQYVTDAGSISYKEEKFVYTGTKGIKFTLPNFDNLKSVSLYRKFETRYRLIGETLEELVLTDAVYDIGTKVSATPYEQKLGKRNYVYTYYSTVSGFESSPSEASLELGVDVNDVEITGFVQTLDPTVDTIKIYRIGGTLVNYYLVESIALSSLAYTDNKSDLDILAVGEILSTTGFIKPPDGINFLTEFNSAIFASKDSTLYFSNPGLVDQWTGFNFIAFPEEITGLGSTQNGLLVFARNKTWIITGESINTYSKQLLNGSQGCISHSTVAYVSNNLLWQSLDGICLSMGGNIELISWPKLGRLSFNPITAEVFDNQYFLFHETGTLIIDFRSGVRFLELDLLARGAYYSSRFDRLYILVPDDIGIYEFGEGEQLEYIYKTGWLTEGKLTNIKSYKKVYIYCIGTAEVKLFTNGTLANTLPLKSGFNEVTFPQIKSKAYYIELEFSGTGEIFEVEFSLEGRQNGI